MKLMKALIIILALAIILSITFDVRSQNAGTVDQIITHAQARSLFTKSVHWDSLREALKGHLKSSNNFRQTLDIFLANLPDPRASFYQPASLQRISGAALTVPSTGATYLQPLDNNISYLRIPALPPGKDLQQQAQHIRTTIDSLLKHEPSGVIVDLRHATGGDAHVLLAGLAPLLDEGLLATSVDASKSITNMYTVHNGNLYLNQVVIGKFAPRSNDIRHIKIAVLVNNQTSGAGELVTIGMKGRKNTRTFGQPTQGDVYGMATIALSSDLAMRFTETYYVDKRGNEYRTSIRPDILVDVNNTANLADDTAVGEATRWLMKVSDAATKVVAVN